MNSSQPGDPNSPPPRPVELKQAKLKLAHEAAMVQDNREVLQMTLADNRQLRQQTRRLRESQLGKMLQDQAAAPPESSEAPDVGDILIDSPTTVHHHYLVPEPTPPAIPPAVQPAPTAVSDRFIKITEVRQPDGSWKKVGEVPIDQAAAIAFWMRQQTEA